jgi:transposase
MEHYAGIDLHSTNSYIGIIDKDNKRIFKAKAKNNLPTILKRLEPFHEQLKGLVVESTYNWYWLVDGLMDAGFQVHLVNTFAAQQYAGLKYSDDRSDARWLAHLLRLGVLPEGYIYPREDRAVRDLLRQRCRLVRQRTANRLVLQNLLVRNTGKLIKGNALKKLTPDKLRETTDDEHLILALDTTYQVIEALEPQIERLEKAVRAQGKLRSEFRILQTIRGVGETLALTIMYETGEIRRFQRVGQYASYCRCVRSERLSNGKRKGEGQRKNGNPYLSWAFHEAAHFAVRFQPAAKRFYERKRARTNAIVAIRALAHKLARATYFMLRDQKAYDPALLFR